MTTIFQALRKRYEPPQWAYFEEVANGTGSRLRRYADGIAMSLYPSRGLVLHCLEVKVTRSDFLRELRNPAKAEELGRRCDYFYIVAPPGVVKDKSELPPAWGYLEFKNGKLKQRKAAERTESVEIDRPFLASLLRRLHQGYTKNLREYVRRDEIQEELTAAEERGRNSVRSHEKIAQRNLDRLQSCVDVFEEHSGIKLAHWGPGNVDLGKAVALVRKLGLDEEGITKRIRDDADRLAKVCDNYASGIRKVLEELEDGD